MVANGSKMKCNSRIKGFVWTMQGRKFMADVLLMPLKGCELTLWIEWLNTMGVIIWDFPNRTMKFQWGGEEVQLDVKETSPNDWNEGNHLVLQRELGLMLIHQEQKSQAEEWKLKQVIGLEELKRVLDMFSMIFQEPGTLPSGMRHDHAISLKEGVNGLSLRPYRYSATQKDVIEMLVKEMLQMGIMQHNNSLFLPRLCW